MLIDAFMVVERQKSRRNNLDSWKTHPWLMNKEPLSLVFWETAQEARDKGENRSARVIAQCEWDDEWRCPMELG